MEYRIVLHRGRQVQLVSVRAYDLRNSKRSELLLVEFLPRAFYPYISGVELDFLSDLVSLSGASLIVSVLFVTSLY